MAKTKLLGSDKEARLKAKKKEQKKAQKAKRKGPIRYCKEVISELKKVTWPSFKDLVKHTGAVIVFIVGMGVVVFAIDTALRALWNLLLK